MIGRTFGRLTVIDFYGQNKHKNFTWKCKCECGNTIDYGISTHSLLSGNTKSCGCISVENHMKFIPPNKKVNKYEIFDQYIVGYTTNKNEKFYIDIDDFEKIKKYAWRTASYGYIETGNPFADKPHEIKLHRFIMNVTDCSVIVDHINMDKMDNRKCNLRIANKQTNGINRGANKNNALGVKGVSKIGNGYVARIYHDGKNEHIGCFKSLNDAMCARNNREAELFGCFSYNPDAPRIEAK